MLRNRAITIISVSLMLLATVSVVNTMRDSKDDVETANRRSALNPGASRPPQPQAQPAHRADARESMDLSLAAHLWSNTERPANTLATKSSPRVRIDNGLLSVEAHNVPLDALLAEISDRSGIPIFNDEAGGQSISISFHRLPLHEGLRRILVHRDTFFLYGAEESHPSALWIYPRGRGRTMVPAPPESWASTDELAQELASNPDAGQRMRAIETVIERKGDESLDSVLYALNDPNEQVRYSALSGALSVGLKLPDGTLENLVLYDRSPFVRSLALKGVSEAPGADKARVREIAQGALFDSSADVQAQAQDVLKALERVDQPRGLSRATGDLRDLLGE